MLRSSEYRCLVSSMEAFSFAYGILGRVFGFAIAGFAFFEAEY